MQEFIIRFFETETGVTVSSHIELEGVDTLITFTAIEVAANIKQIMDTARKKYEQYHHYNPTTH